MILTEKVKLKLTQSQKQEVEKSINGVRWVWNHSLQLKERYYRIYGKRVSFYKLMNYYSKIKRREKYRWLKEITAQAIQQEILLLEKSYDNFFNKKSKFPRFKSKKNPRASYKLPQGLRIINRKTIKIQKLGKVKSSKLQVALSVVPKTHTIKRDSVGGYWLTFCYETEEKFINKSNKSIGVDLGISYFLVDNIGNKIDNPEFYKKELDRIRRAQRKLNRKVIGSSNYRKQKEKLAKLHLKIFNKRNNFHHQVSKHLISDNQTINIEDLKVSFLIKVSHKTLSRRIKDASWSSFIEKLEYKSQLYNRNLFKVDRFFPSTKLCSECGYKNNNLTLSDREWQCSKCNIVHDRDINAARNILQGGPGSRLEGVTP